MNVVQLAKLARILREANIDPAVKAVLATGISQLISEVNPFLERGAFINVVLGDATKEERL